MKVFGYVVFAVVLSLGTSLFAADGESNNQVVELKPHTDGSKKSSPLSKTSSSREVMLDGMDNPVIREAFHNIQLRLLQTPSDALLHRYYTTDPVASSLYDEVKKASERMLNDYSLDAQSNMLQLVRGLTPQYDSFDKLFVEIGIDAGIQREVISNRELYLMPGTLNAATVSGTQGKMIALVTDSLLEGMSRKELAAVLAHEVGHIRAEHPVKGLMNNIMLSIVAELFVTGEIKVNQTVADSLNRMSQEQNHAHSTVCKGSCGHARNLGAMSNLTIDKNSFMGSTIQGLVSTLQNMPKAVFYKSISQYLNVLVQVGQLEKAPPQTIEYFKTLAMAVPRIGTFKIQAQEFMEHASEISLAHSRGKEKTADNISAATTRNINLASADAKLMGSRFESQDKDAQQRIFDQIAKQAEHVQREAAKNGTMFRYVGSTHPALAHRVLRILNTPAYPSVLFANNFLKQLLILQNLGGQEEAIKLSLKSYDDGKVETQKYIDTQIEELKKMGASEVELKDLKEMLVKQVADLKAAEAKSLREVSRARFIQEANVMKLIFDTKFPISAKRAPRFENLIQFLATQKEILFLSAHQMSQNKDAAAELESIRAAIARLDAIGIKVRDRLIAESEKTKNTQEVELLRKRYALLLRVVRATNTTDLENARRDATPMTVLENGLRDIRNKIPLRVNSGEPVRSPFAPVTCQTLFK